MIIVENYFRNDVQAIKETKNKLLLNEYYQTIGSIKCWAEL